MKLRCAETLNRFVLDKAMSWNGKTIDLEELKDFRMQISNKDNIVRIYARNNSHLIKSMIFLSNDGNIIPEYKDSSNRHFVKLDENSKIRFEFFENEKEVVVDFEKNLN